MLQAYQMQPAEGVKQKTFQLMKSIATESKINLEQPPFINKYSNLNSWNKAVQLLLAAKDFGGIRLYPLLRDATVEMNIAWLETFLDEKGHHENIFVESIFILEGTCECNLGGKVVYLHSGDFLEIP